MTIRTMRPVFLFTFLAAACLAAADFDRFEAVVGVDDGAKGRDGESIFHVQVDGKEIYKSELLRPGMGVRSVDVAIAGAKKLTLVIDNSGKGHGGDWGEWLDARLVDSKTGDFVFLTDLQPKEKAWIGACRDRNIIHLPMRVNGVLYLRGWGCISGSELAFEGWSEAVKVAEDNVAKENAEASRTTGSPTLDLGSEPSGLKVGFKARNLSRSQTGETTLDAGAELAITTDPSDPAQAAWWKSGAAKVTFGGRQIPLIDLIQPSERVRESGYVPNREILTGAVKPEQAVWGGKTIGGKGPISFVIADLPLAACRLPQTEAAKAGKLIVKAAMASTHEVEEPEAYAEGLCKLVADGKEIGDVLAGDPSTYEQAIPIDKWPQRLECVTRPGAGGSVGDWFSLDVGIQFPDMKEPLWLHTVDPSFQSFEFGEPDKMVVAGTWRLPGLGTARWLGLQDVVKARGAASAALAEAKHAISRAADKAAIDAAVDKVVSIDPGQSDIRLAAASRFRELKDLRQERRQLGLLLETSRADLSTIQDARKRIDAIWELLLPPACLGYQDSAFLGTGGRGATLREGAVVGGPTGRLFGAYGVQHDEIELGKPAGFLIGPSTKWSKTLTVATPKIGKVAVLVNSRGVECTLAVTVNGKEIARNTSRYPLVWADIPAGKAAATVSVDPDSTGILLDHPMDIVAWSAPTEAALPHNEWQIGVGVRATVATQSSAPVVVAIPRTATVLKVTGASYTLSEPTTEYLVSPDPKLGGSNWVLFAVPNDADKPLEISYSWPDAAYNVPMSHFDWDRINRIYMQTPAALVDTGKKTRWTITSAPIAWKMRTSTPAPTDKDHHVFDVDPQGGLTVVWDAKDVLTPWMCLKHRNLTMYIPDNPNNRNWFPVWMSYLREVYDAEVANTGFEKPNYLYIGVQGASMLSGYGGGTAGDDHTSETWLPATGRCSPYFWMHSSNPSAVDSHELHWVSYGCFVDGLPVWVQNGFGEWIEETGWRCSDLADCESGLRRHLKNAAAALELIKAGGPNPMQSTQEQWDAMTGPMRDKLIGLGWLISETLNKAYGKDFWAKFWTEQRTKNAEAYKKLTPHQKDVFFVNELVRVSGDPKLKDRFEKEWGFDLTP
jgi:hypothetical protein